MASFLTLASELRNEIYHLVAEAAIVGHVENYKLAPGFLYASRQIRSEFRPVYLHHSTQYLVVDLSVKELFYPELVRGSASSLFLLALLNRFHGMKRLEVDDDYHGHTCICYRGPMDWDAKQEAVPVWGIVMASLELREREPKPLDSAIRKIKTRCSKTVTGTRAIIFCLPEQWLLAHDRGEKLPRLGKTTVSGSAIST